MPGITATYVKSVNGLTGQPTRDLEVDAGDFKVEGSSGDTIPQKMQTIANNVRRLDLSEMETDGDFRMSIRNYPLVFQ